MKNLNPRVTELTERLEKGEAVAAITAEFTAKWCISERTLRGYLAVARKQLDERNQVKQSIIDEVRTEAIVEAAKKNVLSDLEVEAVLCSIIKGDYEIEEQRLVDGKTVTIKRKPSHYDVVMAADRLFKKRGSYPTEKQKPQNQTLVLQYNLQSKEDIKYIEGV
jgi:hypothetical protein